MNPRLVAIIAVVATLATVPFANADPMSFLDNGVIRIGVDLGSGGPITYLSSSGADVNVVNNHAVQPLFTSGPNGSWNALVAGATVLEQSNDGLTIYTKSVPMQGACECLIEQWITLDGNAAQVRTRLTNNRSDHTQYDAWGQQEPAVQTNGTFWRLFTYNGNAPYTGGPLTQITGVPGAIGSATEHWAALVNDAGFGLGVFTPFTTQYVGGFNGPPDTGGPGSTGSITPGTDETLDWNIVYEYDYALVLGTLDQIRAYAVAHRPDSLPDYQFVDDRQHFGLFHATDTGWPINGALHVNLDEVDPSLIIVGRGWQAPDVPRIYITAAYHASRTDAQLFWTVAGQDQDFTPEQSVSFTGVGDGAFHTYALDLAGLPGYSGTITGLRFDPSPGGNGRGSVDIVSISSEPPSADLAIGESASVNAVTVGNPLTYTVTVTNDGPSTATGVRMTDTLPATVSFVSAVPSQGTCSGKSTVTCNLGILVSGGSATVTLVVAPTQAGSISNTATVSANEPDPDTSNNSATQATNVNGVSGQLTVLGPARLWVGQGGRSSTLRFDLLVEVLVNGSVVGSGQLSNVKAGGGTFSKAVFDTVPLTLSASTMAVPGSSFSIRASVRASCSSTSTGVSGTARLWYNGQPTDTGRRTADAGSRFAATIGGANATYFLRMPFALATAAGSAKQSIDVAVDDKSACPARPFTPFGTWSVTLQ